MEWYVLNYDFNKRQAYNFNIFNNSRFAQDLRRIYEELEDPFGKNFELFKERLDSIMRYNFWSKTEYEIYVTDAFHKKPEEISKIDVYSQLVPNLNAIAEYIAAHEYVE